MSRRIAVLLALVFSGFCALVFELVWTRLLGFVFGTTSEAIGTVLAVFFGGLAIGNLLAGGLAHRVRRPFLVYAALELAIGLFGLASVPLLERMDAIYGWVGTGHGELGFAAIRILAAAIVLLPPTIAMGATLPVVARGIIAEDRLLGRWSALLYAANTLGSVAGAYLTGFWLIPALGVTRTVFAAAAVNLGVALCVAWIGRGTRVRPVAPPDPELDRPTSPAGRRLAFLAFFGLSGFVAIGYEMVWSKLFAIMLEGTLYGFSAVLSGFLLGIALGSALMAPFVDRIRDLARAFGLLHVATAVAVLATLAVLDVLPYVQGRLLGLLGGGDPTQILFLLVLPVVLVPTALFGAAFPVLIRIHTRRAEAVSAGMGMAIAVNTAGSIAASLLLGFVALPSLGMDATLYGLLILDLLVAVVVLLAFQRMEGVRALPVTGLAVAVMLVLSFSYNGVEVERVLASHQIRYSSWDEYRTEVEQVVDGHVAVLEGRNVVVSVSERPWGRGLRSNGLPEAGMHMGPPYHPHTVSLLGLLPFLLSERAERALVVGLGGGNTVDVLLRTGLSSVDVVELEPSVVEAVAVLYEGLPNPLDDPRVRLHVNDGRNELLLRTFRDETGFDLIASQPSHPWLMGAANLFTEEYFHLARQNLRPGGVFALWVNGFRSDAGSLLAVAGSFERVFPGSVLVDVSQRHDRSALMLLGGRAPLRLPLTQMRDRLDEPGVRGVLGKLGFPTLEDLLARFEGPTAGVAALRPELRNTDDTAYVETRLPRIPPDQRSPFAELDAELPPTAPLLPPRASGALHADDLARSLVGWRSGEWHGPAAKMRRLAGAHGELLAPPWRALLPALADALEAPDAAAQEAADARLRAEVERWAHTPVAWRLWGRFLALERRRLAPAAEAFGRAYALSGASEDAYDAGRALGWSDPEAAWAWLARIPPAERDAWPRIAYFEALHLLRRGASPEALRTSRERLLRFWDSPEGRGHPGLPQALAEVSEALGDAAQARAFGDAAARQREARSRQLLGQIRAALGAGQVERARSVLAELRTLAPGHPTTLQARMEVARAGGSPRELAGALAERRLWAPALEGAIAQENQLRRDLGLPLLPPLEAEELARRARSVVGQAAAGPADSRTDADARALLPKQPTAGS